MGKSFWKNRANRMRDGPGDIDRITKLQSYFPKKYEAAQFQHLQLPHGKYHGRNSDLLIKIQGYIEPVEHDGGIHGFNDEASETAKTKERNDDYVRDGYLPIIVNELQLKEEQISEEMYIRCVLIFLEPIMRAKRRLQLP